MNRVLTCLVVILVLCSITGCYPTYAPPVRIDHYGAPPRPDAHRTEVLGSVEAMEVPYGAHGSVNYGFNDKLQLEVGGNGMFQGWGMGYVGVRYTPLIGLFNGEVKPTLDLEGGLGAGAGGQNECHEPDYVESPEDECIEGEDYDDLNWTDRYAGGGYLGFGGGFNVEFFDFFVRTRVQLTDAVNVPPTFWFSAATGLQGIIKDRVKIYASWLALWGYMNEVERTLFIGGWEVGVSVFLF